MRIAHPVARMNVIQRKTVERQESGAECWLSVSIPPVCIIVLFTVLSFSSSLSFPFHCLFRSSNALHPFLPFTAVTIIKMKKKSNSCRKETARSRDLAKSKSRCSHSQSFLLFVRYRKEWAKQRHNNNNLNSNVIDEGQQQSSSQSMRSSENNNNNTMEWARARARTHSRHT